MLQAVLGCIRVYTRIVVVGYEYTLERVGLIRKEWDQIYNSGIEKGRSGIKKGRVGLRLESGIGIGT